MHTLEDLNLTERFIHHLLQNYNKPCFCIKTFYTETQTEFLYLLLFFYEYKVKNKTSFCHY